MKVYVWDLAVRMFHWALVAAFAANAFYTNPEARAHRWVGYGVAGLIALRLIWGLVGSRHARFADFPPSISGSMGQMAEMTTGRRHVHAGHSPLGALKRFQLLLNRQGFPRGLVCDSSCSGGSRDAQTLVCRYSRPLPEAF